MKNDFLKTLFTVVILLECFSSFGVTSTDSLLFALSKTTVDTTRINILLQLSKKIEKSNADSSVTLCMEALALSNHLKLPGKKADCFKRLAETYKQKPFFEDSEIYFAKEYMRTAEKLNKPLKLADAYYTVGISFGSIPQHDSTINYYEKAIAVAENTGDTSFAMQVRNDMAETYRYSRRMTVCKDIYHSMLNYYMSKNDSFGIAKAYRGIAIVYDIAGVYDSAVFYFRKTADAFKNMKRESNYAASLQNLGIAYTHQKKYDLAEKVFVEAISINSKNRTGAGLYQSYMNLSRVYTATGKAKQAIACADSAVQYSIRENDVKIKVIATGALANAYAADEDYKNAYSQILICQALNDSLIKSDMGKSMSETETRFRTKEKQAQIELLNKEKQIEGHITDRQILIRNLIIAMFILLVILGILYFNRYQLRKRIEQQQAIINDRNRIRADLHDDISSGLTNISLLSEIAQSKVEGHKIAEIDKIAETTKTIMDNMHEIVWTMNEEHNSIEDLVLYIRKYAGEMLELHSLNYDFNMPEFIPGITLSAEKKRNIFLAVKESLHNIVKHAEASLVIVNFNFDSGGMRITVADNGKGIDMMQEKNISNGLKNMKRRMEMINGTFSVENKIGTTLKFNIPLS